MKQGDHYPTELSGEKNKQRMSSTWLRLRLANSKTSLQILLMLPLSQVITPRKEAPFIPCPSRPQAEMLIWDSGPNPHCLQLVTQGHYNVQFAEHGGNIQGHCQWATSGPGIKTSRGPKESTLGSIYKDFFFERVNQRSRYVLPQLNSPALEGNTRSRNSWQCWGKIQWDFLRAFDLPDIKHYYSTITKK